jgi:AcrR family transcriptional regulator
VAVVTAELEGQPTRLDRRKARTRRALIEAARRILAEQGNGEASIQEITDTADVGFGSFYNHFESKAELFEVAVREVLEEYGADLDRACSDLTDSAEIYSVGVRMTARLAFTRPAIAQVVLQVGLSYASEDRGLAPRALRDIRRGIADGRFSIEDANLALIATAGCVLAFLQTSLDPANQLGESDADELAGMLLRMLGMTARSAHTVAHRPLPAVLGRPAPGV